MLSVTLSTSVAAQVRPTPAPVQANDFGEGSQPEIRQQAPIQANQAGQIGGSAVGQVGQRQTRESAEIETGIKPMSRIANRIQNRIQNRIRNRIDHNYDPQANATNPFATAEDQARKSGSPR